jgi:excisionase family DNA binding protein
MQRTHLTPKEVAQRLGVSVERVLLFIDSGNLRAANVGMGRRPRWLVALEDLDRWLAMRSNLAPIEVAGIEAGEDGGPVGRKRKRKGSSMEGLREWV